MTPRRGPSAEAVKAAVPPLAFYRAELPDMPTPRRESGWVNAGPCCFHPDKHATNFRVNLDTGAFKCFACGTKGADVIAFVQIKHSVSFPDALAMLADTWGVRA